MAADKASADVGADACPVDHNAREAWLQHARSVKQEQAPGHPRSDSTKCPVPHDQRQIQKPTSWWPRTSFFSWPTAAPTSSPPTPTTSPTSSRLGQDRVISSIPRSSDPGPSACPAPGGASPTIPANAEADTGASASGNWIYPSEQMFFDAMRRKGKVASPGGGGAREDDMRTVVPIHNAVNERAWKEIKEWEAPYLGTGEGACGGPRLHSFSGDSSKLSPKARIKGLFGYTEPFDRHDWVVDRCGKRIEYIIDFYAGRAQAGTQGKLNFYLDVRPKLNSWDGFKMRTLKGLGLA